jgi:hypothetical protein
MSAQSRHKLLLLYMLDLKFCSKFSYFKIQIFICINKFDGELTKLKVIDVHEFYNFLIDDFFI